MLSAVLGFYYVIFQQYSDTYVKCWIDGSENWNLFEVEKFLDFSQKDGLDYETLIKLKDCLTESSVFLWSVDNKTIRRLSPSFEQESLTQEFFKVLHESKNV